MPSRVLKLCILLLSCLCLLWGTLLWASEASDELAGFGEGFGDAASFGDDDTSLASKPRPLGFSGSLRVPLLLYIDAAGLRSQSAKDYLKTHGEAFLDGSLLTELKLGAWNAHLQMGALRGRFQLQEAKVQYSIGDFVFDLGYMKQVWGKADTAHVFSLINSYNPTEQYYSALSPRSYVDSLKSELMFRSSWYYNDMGQLQIVYAPFFTPDVLDVNGRWAYPLPEAYRFSAPFIKAALADARPRPFSKGQYGQLGLYVTNTFLDSLDLGFAYYWGHFPTPSLSFAAPSTTTSGVTAAGGFVPGTTASSASKTMLELSYDPLHVLALDAGTTLGPVGIRAEFAYYLTPDFRGNNPAVHNNQINYSLGLDWMRDSLMLLVEMQGSHVLNPSTMSAMEFLTRRHATEHTIRAKLSNSFINNQLTLSTQVQWHIQDRGVMLALELAYRLHEDMELAWKTVYLGGHESSLYAYWAQNSYTGLELRCSF